MCLLRDLWATSARRSTLVACLIVLGASGQAAAAALAGAVLVDRSLSAFAGLLLALVAAATTDLAVGLVVAALTADWSADVRRRLTRVAFGQDVATLEGTAVGELLDRIDNDVYQVGAELRGSGVPVIRALVAGAVSVAVAFVVWWPAGLVLLASAAFLGLTLTDRIRRIAPARMAEEEAWSDVAAVTEEAVHGQDDVRTSLARPYVLQLYARRARSALERGRVVWRLSAGVMTAGTGVVRVGIALVVAGGAWGLATGHVDAARLTAVWLLALGFGGTVEQISHRIPELQYGLGAWGRIQLLAASTQERTGGAVPRPGPLTVRGLTLRYPSAPASAPPALSDVRLTFVPGRSYAIVGRSGSGKSTLAKALTRAVDLPRGTVSLAGQDVLDLDLVRLRRFVAVVPQRTEIVAGTLAENVALFDPELIGRVAAAMAELGLTAWVDDLPHGLQTRLGDGGHVLSAGQEQLVAFARILVRDPHVVILDEATARLDPATEARVQRATERLLAGRIGIVIAHRISSLRHCDEVVVLADGAVLEAGSLRSSRRFAALLATSRAAGREQVPAGRPAPPALAADGRTLEQSSVVEGLLGLTPPVVEPPGPGVTQPRPVPRPVEPRRAEPPQAVRPPLPPPPEARTFREIVRLVTNDPRYGLAAVGVFAVMVFLGLDGVLLPWLWARLVGGRPGPGVAGTAAAIVAALLVAVPLPWFPGRWFPEWWTRQMLRIGLGLANGQTGPRRVSGHTPAEVVAQAGDTERVIALADNVIDQAIAVTVLVSMTAVAGSIVPGLFFAATTVGSGLAATGFGRRLERSARRTVSARAAFATALVSSLSAARTIKLAGATEPVLAHLARLDAARSDQQRREISVQVWARSTPSLTSGLLPIGVWAGYLAGGISADGALVAVSTLGAARWFAWTTASFVSQFPSARVWTRRTVAMSGVARYSASVAGVDLSAGTGPAPEPPRRHRLRRLDLVGFGAVHEDGTVGVADVNLQVERGELVLVTGPVGAGKSSLLRALAGIVHHQGVLRWNGRRVTEPEVFLRPSQVGYVAQLPRVLSGTVADNIRLGHDLDAAAAVSTARLEYDLTAAGSGLGLLIGHKGTRLSGGQLQRLALARALAPDTELLIADDVSSALDVTTELELWQALRGHGVTVIGSTSKRAALVQADRVLVLQHGSVVASGAWHALEPDWGHLAG
ncbi:MAG TPA: ABC transporter ATP-binding protein/permease [Kineosporiaceae bacterium]